MDSLSLSFETSEEWASLELRSLSHLIRTVGGMYLVTNAPGNPAIAHLTTAMAWRSLPVPPIPEAVAGAVKILAPDQWGTEVFESQEQYLLWRHLHQLSLKDSDEPYFSFGHGGHGVNSYAFTMLCRIGPLLVATQSHWVDWEIYSDWVTDAAAMARQFQYLRRLFAAVEERRGPPRLLLIDSYRSLAAEHQLVALDDHEALVDRHPRLVNQGNYGALSTSFDNATSLFEAAAERLA